MKKKNCMWEILGGVWTDLEMQSVSVMLWATSFFGQKLSVSEDDPLFTGLGVDKIDQS